MGTDDYTLADCVAFRVMGTVGVPWHRVPARGLLECLDRYTSHRDRTRDGAVVQGAVVVVSHEDDEWTLTCFILSAVLDWVRDHGSSRTTDDYDGRLRQHAESLAAAALDKYPGRLKWVAEKFLTPAQIQAIIDGGADGEG
jgi:hypothetical protein